MASKILKKTKYNAIAGYLKFVITSLMVFALSPLLVHFLGAYSFGVWKTIQKILTFASITDGRATQALKWVIANDETNTNEIIKQQAVGSAVKVWFLFLPIMLLTIVLLVWNLPFFINELETSMYGSVYTVGLILGANFLINPLLAIPDAVLVGTNNGYKSISIQTIGVILSNFLMVFVCYLGYGIIGLASVVILITLVNGLFVFYICKKNITWLGIQKPSKEQLKRFFGFSFWVLCWSFIQKLILATEIVLIGYLMNPTIVTNYIFTAYLMQLAISAAILAGSSITPALGRIIGANDIEKAKILVKTAREIILCISLFFAGIILILNKSLVDLWMGSTYFLGEYVNLLIVLIMVQFVLGRFEGQVQDLSLNIKKKVLAGAGFSVLSIVLGVFCYYTFNESLEGLLLGVFVGRFLLNISFSAMVNRMLNLKAFFRQYIYVFMFISVVFYISQFMIEISNWFSFGLISFAVVGILFLFCFKMFLSKKSQNKILQLALNKN